MQNPYLDRIGSATAKLLATVAGLDDVAISQPSLLPGWDRAMVVAHLAGNAEGLCRVVEAASQRRVGEVYPGGQPARDAAIEASRGLPAGRLEERLQQACEAAAAALVEAPEAVWDAPCISLGGEVRIGPGRVVGRLREVEVHHVDLNCSYSPEDWPVEWVTEEMDRAMLALPRRLPRGTAVYLSATDVGQHWVAGSGDAVEISGRIAQLFAWVTGRATSIGGSECPPLAPFG